MSKNYLDKDFRVDFIGLGAAKCGSTWLADCLRQHPDIYMSETKELMYFNSYLQTYEKIDNYRYGKPLKWYHDFFKNAKTNQVKGEITPMYLICEGSVHEIYKYNPNVKLFAILRNPVDKSYSHYLYYRQRGYIDSPTFREAIKDEPSVLDNSLYFEQLKPYFELFPRENIKIVFYEDLKKDNKALLADIEHFLGVKTFYPESIEKRSNATGEPRLRFVNKMLMRIRAFIHSNNLQAVLPILRKTGIVPLAEYIRDHLNAKKMDKKAIEPALREELKAYFREDVSNLEKLLETDLSHWK